MLKLSGKNIKGFKAVALKIAPKTVIVMPSPYLGGSEHVWNGSNSRDFARVIPEPINIYEGCDCGSYLILTCLVKYHIHHKFV